MGNAKDVKLRPVPIQLDKQRHLLFDLNAFAEIEEKFGSIEEAMKALEKGSIKAVRVLLWAGLVHEELDENDEPKISVREVGSWVSVGMLEDIAKKLGEAIKEAYPEAEEEKHDPLVQKPPTSTVPPKK
jgi:hypothetical protein